METLTSQQEVTTINNTETTHKSLVFSAPQKVEVKEVKMPAPGKGEVRVKLEGCGVCASNIPSWEGREWFNYPMEPGAPGHEGWGIVDAVGEEVTCVKVGDRVACLSYHSYAQYDVAKADEVVKLPSSLDDKPFPGEALGCAMNIFNRSAIEKDQTVAIVGMGFLGLLLTQLIKAAGAKVIGVSRREFSLQAAEYQRADHSIVMEDHYEVIAKVKEITDGAFCDRVIEVTGKEWPLNLSIELTKEKGKLIVAGFHQDGMRQVNMQLLNWRGIDMISAHERDPQQYITGIKNAIQAIEEGRLNPFPLFTHSFLLQEADHAFFKLTDRPDGFIKALIINE